MQLSLRSPPRSVAAGLCLWVWVAGVCFGTPGPAWSQATATLVSSVETSSFNPPSPDPAGIAYLPHSGKLLAADSEVDEMSIFAGANLFELGFSGVLEGTGDTLAYSSEPTGLAFNPGSGHLFVSDDSAKSIFEVAPGIDAVFGTADDVVTQIDLLTLGSADPEGVAFDPLSGDLFVLDGFDRDVHRISPGSNGVFDGFAPVGDDLSSSFDVGAFGALDPEGIAVDPATGSLLIADRLVKSVLQVTIDGDLLRTIDVSAVPSSARLSGIVVAPGSAAPGEDHLYMSDRGVDNDTDPDENDGRIFELDVSPFGGNLPPSADAGVGGSLMLPNDTVQLQGSVIDDGLPGVPGTLTTLWSQVSGPGTVVFSAPTALSTAATLPVAGTYVLRLTADDAALTGTDDIVFVLSEGIVFEAVISQSSDDSEERSTGSMKLASDLELVDDPQPQNVGLRFTGVMVPPGAAIVSAYVQFQVDEVSTGAASLSVRAEAVDDAPTFSSSSFDISSRATTSASAAWSPPPWDAVGAAGLDQRTSDLSAVVQQVVDRQGWVSGNAIALLFTGTGERTAKSFDQGNPARLHLEYLPSQPVPAFSVRGRALLGAALVSGAAFVYRSRARRADGF